MRGVKAVNDTLVKEIRRLWHLGWHAEHIATTLNISKHTVYNYTGRKGKGK